MSTFSTVTSITEPIGADPNRTEGKMSFSSDVKRELMEKMPAAKHCREAAAAAMLYSTAEFFLRAKGSESEEIYLKIYVDDVENWEKRFTLILKNATITLLSADDKGAAKELAEEFGYIDPEGRLIPNDEYAPEDLLKTKWKKECCRYSFLRELFIHTGSVSDPEKEYHMEFVCRDQASAEHVQNILNLCGVSAKIIQRKKHHIVYLKDSTEIASMLNMMGASLGYMRMENLKILKDVRNSVNRRVNCETANISKMVGAAHKQIEDIILLEERDVLRTLPQSLRIIAELRLEYPDISLKELGSQANPPISKSGVNHRLRRISEIAKQVREESV